MENLLRFLQMLRKKDYWNFNNLNITIMKKQLKRKIAGQTYTCEKIEQTMFSAKETKKVFKKMGYFVRIFKLSNAIGIFINPNI
jgi:hypothetical protein